MLAFRSSTVVIMRWLTLAAGLLAFSASHAASFDCNRARTEDERAICANPKLSKMDEVLAEHYKEAIKLMGSGGPRHNAFRTNQAAWIKERARCGDTVPCLSELMQDRIDWMMSPLHHISGEYSTDRLSVLVVHNGNNHKVLVRIYGSRTPSDNALMASDLQAKWMSAQANNGEDAVHLTPMWHVPHRTLDGQCSAIRMNFGTDGLMHMTVNPGCPLLKSVGGTETLELQLIKPVFMSAMPPR